MQNHFTDNIRVFCRDVLRINHIINPYTAKVGSENYIAQPICQASIAEAQKYAAGTVDVQLYFASSNADTVNVHPSFLPLGSLSASILDHVKTSRNRALPLFAGLLKAAAAARECDYIVYTNADIGVMPGFYKQIELYTSKGYDAFAINRRRIPAKFTSVDQLEEIYAEAGEKHTGYDTIIFKSELLSKFTLGNVAIGIPYFDTTLMHNLYAHSNNFRLFTGKHLTFHIGMGLVQEWGDDAECAHNKREFLRICRDLYPKYRIEQFPGAGLSFFKRHFKWLMNPTFHYPTMLRLDISQWSRPRRKYRIERSGKLYRWGNWLIQFVNFPDEE